MNPLEVNNPTQAKGRTRQHRTWKDIGEEEGQMWNLPEVSLRLCESDPGSQQQLLEDPKMSLQTLSA